MFRLSQLDHSTDPSLANLQQTAQRMEVAVASIMKLWQTIRQISEFLPNKAKLFSETLRFDGRSSCMANAMYLSKVYITQAMLLSFVEQGSGVIDLTRFHNDGLVLNAEGVNRVATEGILAVRSRDKEPESTTFQKVGPQELQHRQSQVIMYIEIGPFWSEVHRLNLYKNSLQQLRPTHSAQQLVKLLKTMLVALLDHVNSCQDHSDEWMKYTQKLGENAMEGLRGGRTIQEQSLVALWLKDGNRP